MARYGLDFYGYPKYGSATQPVFRAEPFARCVDYGSILVDWVAPAGAWTHLRLVRSSSGPPIATNDGVTVVEGYRPNNAFLDGDLVSGREYHYTVFVYAVTVGTWINAGSASARCARNYGYTDALWRRLPGLYKLDSFAELTATQVETSTLRRFLSIFGFQLDVMRTDLDALMKIASGAEVPYAALPAMLRQLGFDPEPELTSRVSRQLAANSLPLYQSKGSALCLENLTNVVAGWDCDIRLGHNKLLDDTDTMTSLSVGRWKTDYQNATVQARANESEMATFRGDGYITLDPAGEAYVALSKEGRSGRLHTVPIVQGRRYMASVYARGTGEAQIGIDWYSSNGSFITSVAGPQALAVNSGWDTRLICAAVAPPGARFAGIRVVAQDGAPIHFNAAQFEDRPLPAAGMLAIVGSDGEPTFVEETVEDMPADWQPARQVFFVLRADAINEIRNPGGQTENDSYWSGRGFEAPPSHPDPEIEARWRGDGFMFRWADDEQIDADDYRVAESYAVVHVVPGQQWTFLAEVRPSTTYDFTEDTPAEELTVNLDVAPYLNLFSGSVDLGRFNAADTDFIHIEATTQYADYDGAYSGFEDDWLQIRLTYTVPEDGSVTAIVPGFLLRRKAFDTAGPLSEDSPDALRIRRVALVNKPGEVAFYFDGSTPTETADFIWEGVPYASRSHYYERRTIKAQRLRALAPKFLPAGRAFTLLFAQPEPTMLGSDHGVVNYDVNPAGPPDLTVSTQLDIRWRRLASWDDLMSNNATWDDVVANNPTWNDVQDGS